MAIVTSLTAQPLVPGRSFNWIFLIELLVCGILTLFFLFYFNRLFATIVSYGLRAYTWHKYRVYIDIQALQVSLLGGRIFFKGFRYHGENETFLIQQGYITWNYWLRAVKQADCGRFVDDSLHRPESSNEDVRRASQPSGIDSEVKEAGDIKAVQGLPSRISVSLSGFEWFIYNRSPAYAAIAASDALNSMHHPPQPDTDNAKRTSAASETFPKVPAQCSDSGIQQVKQTSTPLSSKPSPGDYSMLDIAHATTRSNQSTHSHVPDSNRGPPSPEDKVAISNLPISPHDPDTFATPFILTLFPIMIECQKGAIVIGNEHTRVILSTNFDRCKGHIDASSSSPRDIYRQLFEFEVTHPSVRMKPNPDYRQSQQVSAQTVVNNAAPGPNQKRRWSTSWRLRHRKRKVMHGLRNLVPYFRSSVESFRPSSVNEQLATGEGTWPQQVPGESRWLGLSRYLDENEGDDHEGWSNVEYARFSNIVDCPSVHFSFYWDVPGPVTTDPDEAKRPIKDQDINFAKPPAYGLDLVIRGGNVEYGPWADRARAEIQSVFFPNGYQDAAPAKPLPVGVTRQSTVLNINVHIENETTLRMPTRENSKDWQWKGRAGALRGASGLKQQKDKKQARKKDEKNLLGPDVRPFGWFAISLAPNSAVTYNMDMIARQHGYHNSLELDLKGTEMTTSVNHSLLWKCGPQKIICDISNPLGWNALHTWTFDVQSHSMELFLLRDHIFLLTDLIGDFTSGPPGDFLTFLPFLYRLRLSFRDVKLYLNVNDSNIIDNPCDVEENTFLMLHGETLDASVDIPLRDYAPSTNKIDFRARAQDARLDIATPVWNTAHIFASDMPIATLKDFSMDGSYNSWSSTSPSLTDSLFLNLTGFSPRIYLQGSLIRYCMKLKDNYFGEDMHFRTLEEYQQLLFKRKDTEEETVQFQDKKDNDMDVILNVTFHRVCALLPANIYSRRENLRLDFLLVEADVRFTNYYMDMNATFSPIEAAWESVKAEQDGMEDYVSKPQAFVDGINVYGHRLFGSAPSEPTYMCNWDFEIGEVTGDCVPAFFRTFLKAIRSFAFTMDDEENALPQSHTPALHDVTFLRAKVEKISLWFLLEETAILFAADQLEVTFDDWAGKSFSERLNLVIPSIQLAATDHQAALRHKNQLGSHTPTLALFELSFLLKMVDRKREFNHDRELQQQHVQFHDQRTHRTSWLLHDSFHMDQNRQPKRPMPYPPAMSVPHLPAPLSKAGYTHASELSTESDRPKAVSSSRLRQKKSYDSNASSLQRPPLWSRTSTTKAGALGSSRQSDESPPRSKSRNEASNNRASEFRQTVAWKQHLGEQKHFSLSAKPPIRYSSPWTKPYFPLQSIAPDERDLPELPCDADVGFKPRPRRPTAPEIFDPPDNDSETVHTWYDINLGSAVRGFATPRFYTAVAALIKALQSVHPTDLLDDLQVDTISQIRGIEKIRTKLTQATDFRIRVPFAHLRLVNSASQWREPSNYASKDQYDLQAVESQITARFNRNEKMVGDRPNAQNDQRLHISIKRSLLEVHDRSTDVCGKAAVSVLLEDCLLWIASDERTIGKYQQREVEVTSWRSRIEYLIRLLNRTVDMSEFIVDQFAFADLNKRTQSLVYHLTDVADAIADPVFLTKPSYVLRTADNHLRLNDSWKIASRLRHMLHSLNSSQKQTLFQPNGTPKISIILQAEDTVLEIFDKWRPWDLTQVRKSLIMQIIWKHAEAVGSSSYGDLLLELTLEEVDFVLDPGPKENRISLHDISTAVSTRKEVSHRLGKTDADVGQPRLLTIQTYCSSLDIHLNWELVELIDDTMKVIKSMPKKLGKSSSSPTDKEYRSLPAQQLHFVFGMDSGVITLDSISATVAMAVSSAKGSIMHEVKEGKMEKTSMLLTSRSASTRLKHDGKVVMGCLLDNLIVSLSHNLNLQQVAEPVVMRADGKCGSLRFEMREDMANIIEIATNIIRDELTLLKRLSSQSTASSQPATKNENPAIMRQRDIYLTLFLDQYTISVAILPLLVYVVSGNMARTSMVPRSSSKMVNNFDLGHHSHSLKLKSREEGTQVAALDVPPINGKVVLSRSKQDTRLDLDMTMDKVELEARSVRACVDMMNTSTAVRAVLNAKKGAQEASSEWRIFSSSPTRIVKNSDDAVTFRYSVNMAFIGLGVHASAPALKSKDYRADLEFALGLTTVYLGNESVKEDVVHEKPQFDVGFRHISLNIHRQSGGKLTEYGNVELRGNVTGKTGFDDNSNQIRMYHAASDRFDVELHPESASLAVDIAAHLRERIKSFTLTDEVKRLKPLRRLTVAGLTEAPTITVTPDNDEEEESASSSLFDSMYSLEMTNIKFAWRLDASMAQSPSREVEDLVFSIQKVDLNTKRGGSATLAIAHLQLQMVAKSLEAHHRSLNSAIMPDVIFKAAHISTKKARRLAVQAAGKALDLRIASDFIVPLTALRTSLAAASSELREGNAIWAAQPATSTKERNNLFSSKYLASLLIDVDFAGAVVSVQPRRSEERPKSKFSILKGEKRSRAGRYDQAVQVDGTSQATLRAPGVAVKIEYSDNRQDDATLNAEIKVAASSNVLYPSVVPLVIEITSSLKEIMDDPKEGARTPVARRRSEVSKPLANSSLASSNPANLMGRCKLNVGLWIREQDFSLSCQPIARVAATARFNDIFMTVNTVQSPEQERFFALSVTCSNLQASVQHVYSRESTASFDVDSIVLSMMNSRHVSDTTGISTILKVSPMKASVNAKQLQDFLLFREIWYPAELRKASSSPPSASTADNQAFVVQRYQQVAAAGTFPWNAVVSVQELTVQLDLGQSLGITVFTISQLWASSKKASDFEQNLCLGFDKVKVESTGRMSGLVELQNFRVRTSIRWSQMNAALEQTPLVQASLGVDHFRVNAAFDYQPFAVAEILKIEFLMYNVRPSHKGEKDRLVGNLEGEKVQVFCTTGSASQALALYQAVVRLIQEKEMAYQASLKELDKYLRRKSVFPSSTWTASSTGPGEEDKDLIRGPFSLHTDVVVTLRAVNLGAFPSTFYDNQIFKIEATDAQARFNVSAQDGRTHSGLGLTLGQLRVALSTVNRANTQALVDISVSDVVSRATSSRGGTILKVPKVVAAMQTWQSAASSNHIDYVFNSSLEGKVDVGWNYSRISFIRNMWTSHSRALASRLGKPLPRSAVQISGGGDLQAGGGDGDGDVDADGDGGKERGRQEKITAVVNVPQSRFEYTAVEPPVIETPQLRDMGEATPPLEWIGLHRDKLPNVTHQVIIVPLLEVAKEVEEAYVKILGSSQ